MDKEPKIEKQTDPEPGEVRLFKNGKFRWVPTGYTVRQYFSHESEKGPGPGWDFFLGRAEKLIEKYKINKKPYLLKPKDLPDEPYYKWQPVFEDKKDGESEK